MKKQLFTPQQLFQLKRKTLEKRITNYYEETRDGDRTIKYLVALQVRDRLGTEDFSGMLRELVRHLFLKTKATRTLQRFFNCFKTYFTPSEWRKMVARLLSSKTRLLEKMIKLRKKITGSVLPIFYSWGQVSDEPILPANIQSDLQIKTPTAAPKKMRWLLERFVVGNSS